jgi:hypothetical protein
MVAIGEHDHGDGHLCPGCKFRELLAALLTAAHEDGSEEWHWAVGALRQRMLAALVALDAIEAEPYTDDDSDDDPAEDAADAIAAVGSEIHELWHALMDDHDKAPSDPV